MSAAPTRQAAHAPVVLDVDGLALTDDDRRRIAHPLTGGLILFARNGQSRAQLTALTAEIKSIRPDVLICVDQEGGRVQRFRQDGYTRLPPMRRLGAMWADDPSAAARVATAAGYVLAAELRACGIDFSFTPVLDLDHGASTVIGDRAFARDPRVVAALARCLNHGLLLAGMRNCGKHFPGHGHAAADSHFELPIDTRALETILADDAQPYRELGIALASVMPAHIVYSAVDARPAGFSQRWLNDILRGRLGFDGAIFSDDLGMAAARRLDGREISHVEAAILALNAGCDLVLLCNQSAPGRRDLDVLLDGLAGAAATGRWRPSAASGIRRRELLPAGPAAPWDELQSRPAYGTALETLGATSPPG